MRIVSAGDSVATFLNAAVNRAERHQIPVALVISPKEAKLTLYSNEPGFTRELIMPDGVTIEAVLPPKRASTPRCRAASFSSRAQPCPPSQSSWRTAATRTAESAWTR